MLSVDKGISGSAKIIPVDEPGLQRMTSALQPASETLQVPVHHVWTQQTVSEQLLESVHVTHLSPAACHDHLCWHASCERWLQVTEEEQTGAQPRRGWCQAGGWGWAAVRRWSYQAW